ncbi:hypothetical protein AcW1_003441 [Taiwanofungus camphoratus]|nr:hypothetical protein AcV5_002099 [Antrodia cinnamomea]KAI0941583.1 hypothetical protein AcW1_003441 [Antrodia cinnamomea]KAI0943922.1 hypothetical protein AcV7_001874 [Antrodia cinnamomea]
MLSLILSVAGWSYLPDFATRQLLPLFHYVYRNVLRRSSPPPQSTLYVRHYRYLYAFAVVSYLLYNFWDAAVSMAPNYYEILGVGPNADENALKAAFRQFARKNHPDRVGQQGEGAFMEVRDAFEALKNPVTRYAYDRFGPDALRWTTCVTDRDYVRHGVVQSAGFYIVATCCLLFWSFMSTPSGVSYWRYVLLNTVCAYEAVLILSPSLSPHSNISVLPEIFPESTSPALVRVFAFIWPRRVAYQHIRFLHSLFMFLSVALSRVAPVLFPSLVNDHVDSKKLQGEIERIGLLARLIDREVSSQVQTELHSVHGPRTGTQTTDATFAYVPPIEKPADEVIDLLTAEMEKMIIETQLRDGGPLKSAVDAAIEKKREAEQRWVTRTGMPSPTPSPPPEPSLKSPLRGSHLARADEHIPAGYVRGRSQSL